MPAEQPSTINWSLKKILVREDIDLSSQAGKVFLTWKRQFTSFLRESGTSREGVLWEAKWSALESCVTTRTFKKIEALMRQLPVDDREKVNSVLVAVTEVAGATETYGFTDTNSTNAIKRVIRLFYSELVTLASLCKFDEGLCDADKQQVIDLFLLNKIMFSIHDRAAQKKLFEEKELNLTKAIKTRI